MILGLSSFGFIHTVLSLVALVSGLIVVVGLVASKRLDALTILFLVSAAATNATGFGFSTDFGILQYVGTVALLVILAAILARYAFHLAGPWRWVYAISTIVVVYSLVFFTVGEIFRRVPVLQAMAPTLTELPFVLAELAALALFVALAIAAVKRFRPG